MQEAWTGWLATLWDQGRIDTIIQIGAGDGLALEALLQGPARRIVLIEPDPEMAMALQARARGDARVSVLNVAIGARSGEAVLHRLNVPGMSAITRPENLYRLFPGLREVGQTPVEVLDLPALIDRLELAAPPAGAAHALRVDAPGSEHAILAQLGALPVRFDYLSVRTSVEPLYKAAPADGDLSALLEPQGYRVDMRRSDDPDFPEYGMRFDPSVQRIADLTQALSESQAARDALHQEQNAWKDQIETAREDARLALRLKMLQAADLTDLQQRYAALLEEKRHQDDLLQQVTARLTLATGYLRQLGPQGLEPDAAEAIGFEPQPATNPKKSATKPKKVAS